MGDISEMMLDGTLCEYCGCYIEEGEAEGYPRKCTDCQEENSKKKKRKGNKKVRGGM